MSENAPSTFRCYKCKKKSQYLNRKTTLLMEFQLGRLARPETRTYKCTNCGEPNEITMQATEWDFVIHAGG